MGSLLHLPEQFIRFGVIGVINTAFAYTVYAVAIFFGAHYTVAVLLSTVLGICFSFKTMGNFVFDNPDNTLIFKFILVYSGCYFLNIGFLKILTLCGVSNLYIAGFISQGLVACVSFCFNKFFVFRKRA